MPTKIPTKYDDADYPFYADLRGITRDADKVITEVTLELFNKRNPWLVFGQANLRSIDHGKVWLLESYLKDDATDLEHDSAYALRLPLIGVTLEGIYYHTARIEAWVYPGSFHDFHVPVQGYDPFHMEDTMTCNDCEKPHIIVPRELYVPPFNQNLFDYARGGHVSISIGEMPEEDVD